MDVLRITWVGLLLYILLRATFGDVKLPEIPGNRLSVEEERNLPNATPIQCGESKEDTVTVKKTRRPSEVLANFGNYAFTAAPIGSPNSPNPERVARFKFAEVPVKTGKTVYALEVAKDGERAYWLRKGSFIDIPREPKGEQPHYVFTSDLTGSSWTVTPLKFGKLRLRHVDGGKEVAQFNNKTTREEGGPVTFALQYKDYGYIVNTRSLVSNSPGFAYMHFSNRIWTLYVQTKGCAPHSGSPTFTDNLLTKMTLVQFRSNNNKIPKVTAFKVPDFPV